METDNASQEVINQTDSHVVNKARFYFRPLTPTQFYNEGLYHAPNQNIPHCPCPVFFLFDTALLQQYPKAWISEKTLASHSSLIDATTDMEQINLFDYNKIYHYGEYNKNSDNDIVKYRHAEFAVDDEVDFTNLKYIVTRSLAERESLLYYLHSKKIFNFDDKIVLSNGDLFPFMFYKQRLFIDEVELNEKYINIKIENYSSEYDIKCYIKYDNGNIKEIKMEKFTVNIPQNIEYNFYTFAIIIANVY